MFIEEWVLQALIRRANAERYFEVYYDSILDCMADQIAADEDSRILQYLTAAPQSLPQESTNTQIVTEPLTKGTFGEAVAVARRLTAHFSVNLDPRIKR